MLTDDLSMTTSMLDEVLFWARAGMHVFPVYESSADRKCACGPTAECNQKESWGKHPRISRWQLLASRDERQIREWWGNWPEASIGICCGEEVPGGGRLLVVDVDPRHDGDVSLSLLEELHGPLPHTVRNLTGGGGQHLFFRTPRLIKSRSEKLGPGLDIKCDRGYVLAPPSWHVSGRRYSRDAGADITETAIADAPDWLLILADPPETRSAASVKSPSADAFIEGGRHDAIVSLAGALRRRGLQASEMLPSMLAVNSARCRPPLDEHEIKTIAYSARWEAQDPIGKHGSDPWKLMSATEIFSPLGSYPWLIEGVQVAPGRPTLLSSLPDVGKTVVAISLAISVATGTPLWGMHKPSRSGKVIHLNGEIGSYLARERYQRLARGAEVNIEQVIADGSLVLSNYPTARLDDADFEDRLAALVDGSALVIVDSLRAFSGALDEKAKDLGVALFKLARISDATGTTFVVLHHNRKPSREDVGPAAMSISGNTAIVGACECVFVFSTDSKGGVIRVEHERSPTGRRLDDFGLLLADITTPEDPRYALAVRHLDREQMAELERQREQQAAEHAEGKAILAITRVLERYAGVWRGGRDGLRAESGVAKGVFTRALNRLIRSGSVTESGTYHKPEFRLSTPE